MEDKELRLTVSKLIDRVIVIEDEIYNLKSKIRHYEAEQELIDNELDKYPTDNIVKKYLKGNSNKSVSLLPLSMIENKYNDGILGDAEFKFYSVSYNLSDLSEKQFNWIVSINKKINKSIKKK